MAFERFTHQDFKVGVFLARSVDEFGQVAAQMKAHG